MIMNMDEQKKDAGNETRYPLDKYIKQIPAVELSIDFSTLGKFPLTEEDLTKLQEIKTLVKSAEEEINILASKSFKQDGEVFHIEQPSYFDDNFDQDKYVRDLVNAKFQGMKIIEHENAATKVQKIIMLKKAIDKMNQEDSESSDTITIHKVPKVYQVKMTQNNNTVNKNTQNKMHTTRDIEQESNADSIVKVTSHEVVQVDEKRSEERFNRISKSNHKIIEIKSTVNEEKTNLHQRQLVVSKSSGLTVEVMPSINIRSQLMEQKIPSLDIFPTDKNNSQPTKANNIALVSTEHQDIAKEIKAIEDEKKIKHSNVQVTSITQDDDIGDVQPLVDDKKVSLKTASSEIPRKSRQETKPTKKIDPSDKSYMFLNRNPNEPMVSEMLTKKISKLKKYGIPEIQQIYNPKTQIYKRCPTMFSRPDPSSNKYLSNISKQPVFLRRDVSKYGNDKSVASTSYTRSKLDSEYIPYSKLTIGGYRVDQVEKIMKSKSSKSDNVIPDIEETNQNDEYLEDENESEKSSIKNVSKSDSDENDGSQKSQGSDDNSLDKYMDDFDIEYKSDNSDEKPTSQHATQLKKQKVASLGFKSKVDVYDFVNYVETKDDSTQSSPVKSVSYRETQTSPEQEDDINQNKELPKTSKSIDASNITLADMLQIQKVLSTLNSQMLSSKFTQGETEQDKRRDGPVDSVIVLQIPSNSSTQTSPLRNKHVMTSPAKMVGKILSPVFDDTKVDAGTNPWDYDDEKVPNNYSMPGTSRQNVVLSSSPKKSILKDSTDAFTDVSHSESSESHSLGEINLSILRKKSFIIKKHNKSNSTSTSLGMSSSSDVQMDSSNYYVPKKSDGEISEGQILKNI